MPLDKPEDQEPENTAVLCKIAIGQRTHMDRDEVPYGICSSSFVKDMTKNEVTPRVLCPRSGMECGAD